MQIDIIFVAIAFSGIHLVIVLNINAEELLHN